MAIYTEKWPSPQYAANTITELELNHTQNITGNYTTVSYAVRVKRINNYNDNWTPSSGGSYTTLSIGGISVLSSARHNWTTLSNNANHTANVVSGSVNVPHDANGAKTIAYSLTFSPNVSSIGSIPNRVISGSFTPPAIPRVSKATISKASFNFGEAVTLTTNRASTAFTHKVYYIDSAGTVTLSTNMGASGSISVPVARMSSHITSASVAMTIRVITVSGGVDIGTHNISVTVNVPSSVVPTVGSLAIAETVTKAAAVFNSANQFISGVSRVKATAGSVAGTYGSTISRYYFQVKEVTSFAMNSTANNVTFPVFSFPSSGSAVYTIQVCVMDSRGRYSSWRDASIMRVHYYRPPTIGNPTTIRLSTPTTLQVVRNYSVQALNQGGVTSDQKNTASYYIRTRSVGSTAWTTNASAGNTELSLTNSSANLAGSFSASTMWEVQAVVTDKLNTATSAVITVSTEFATMEVLKGTGIGVGKAPVAGQGNLQVGTAGISSEGPLKATTLDVTGSGGNIQPLNTIYNPTNGVLIDICGHHTINMITVYVQGHGYGHMPINSIFQTYHYYTIGSFMNTRQMNFGHALPTGTFFVHGTRIKLWIPPTAAYKTFTITATGMNGAIYNVGLSNSAFPGSITYRHSCEIHKSWNEENHGPGSGMNADLLDGRHASSFFDLSNVDLLQDNVNINSLTTPGIYQRSSDAAVTAMTNTPDNYSGYLEVFGTGTMVYQRWTSYLGNNVYVRRYYNGWSSWTNINGGVTTGGSGFDRWVRFSSGETIAWGRHSSSASAANFNFSKTFSAAPLVTVNASMADFNPGFNLTGISTSSFSVSVVDARNGGLWNKGTYMLHYQAMGMS